jgi:hypothetical protein
MDEFKDETSNFVSTFKASGGGGWGFGVFNLGGSKESSSQTQTSTLDTKEGAITSSGISLIGYICEPIGKAPNPKADLTWVGED